MLAERCLLVVAVVTLLVGDTAAGTMLGGFQKHEDTNDAGVQEAAQFAVSEISKDLKLEKILSAHKQVVAGMNYKFELQTSGGNFEATVFKGLGDAPHELKTYKRMEGGGGGGDSGGQVGGSKELSADDKEVQQAAQAALEQLSSQSNSLFPYKLQEVVKASSQVHGGGTQFSLQLKAAQGDMPATTFQVDVTRTLENAQYKLGEVSKVGPASQ